MTCPSATTKITKLKDNNIFKNTKLLFQVWLCWIKTLAKKVKKVAAGFLRTAQTGKRLLESQFVPGALSAGQDEVQDECQPANSILLFRNLKAAATVSHSRMTAIFPMAFSPEGSET